ncbi:MAG: DUF5666 domain-containing protein [Limnobacter sp.]|nr:DUF5666 domain-containing protein [Limnobacter sp.]
MISTPTFKHLALSTVTVSVLTLLAACGSDNSDTPSNSEAPNSNAASGTVTGFGSLIVDGIRYDDSLLDNAGAIQIEGDDASLRNGTRSDLSIGQKVDIGFRDANVLTSLRLGSEIVGFVTVPASGNMITVAGQRVKINVDPSVGPLTFLSDITSINSLTVDDRVEVHGVLGIDNNGSFIQARRLEREPSLDEAGAIIMTTKLTGVISNFSTTSTGRRFTLGSITVNVPTSTNVDPAGLQLANGVLVKVFSTTGIVNGTLTANAIRSNSLRGNSSDFRVSGVVTNLDTNAKTFKVDGTMVNGAALNALPTLGSTIRVDGRYDSATQILTARDFKFSKADVTDASLRGSITEYVSNSNFVVRGITVDASEVPGLTGLANAVFVEVTGAVNNGTVKATAVSVRAPDAGSRLEGSGTVSALNTAAKTFQLGTQVVNYNNATFEDGVLANLTDGSIVKVEGVLSGGVLQAREIEFRTASSQFEVEGVLQTSAAAEGSNLRFILDGINLVCSPSASLQACSATTLRDGAKVEAKYQISGTNNIVTRLKLKSR